MNNRKKIIGITQTAIFIALLLVVQTVTKPMGQFVTGGAVNFVLIAAVMLGGLYSGITVAAVSPFFAFMMGIGPIIFPLTFAIAVGNIVLVLSWHFVTSSSKITVMSDFLKSIVATIIGAVLKFLTLYFGVVHFIIPVFLTAIAEKQVVALTAMFSTPQLITALIGGAVAVLALPLIKKAMPKK